MLTRYIYIPYDSTLLSGKRLFLVQKKGTGGALNCLGFTVLLLITDIALQFWSLSRKNFTMVQDSTELAPGFRCLNQIFGVFVLKTDFIRHFVANTCLRFFMHWHLGLLQKSMGS